MNKKEQVKKFESNYPEHHHPHGVDDTEPNDNRIWVCTECPHIFTDAEIRDSEANGWGHDCKMHPCRKGQRCESHLEPYLPAPALYSEKPTENELLPDMVSHVCLRCGDFFKVHYTSKVYLCPDCIPVSQSPQQGK